MGLIPNVIERILVSEIESEERESVLFTDATNGTSLYKLPEVSSGSYKVRKSVCRSDRGRFHV